MSTSDTATLEKLRSRVGRPFRFEMEKERCTALDLTSEDYIWSGLIRHHSQNDKDEILGLVCELNGLKKLNLRRNHLGRLPEAFRGLTELEELNLGSNQLGIIPGQLRELKRLKYLHLGNNYITTVPEFVSELQALEYFTLHKNIRIKSVENIAGLKRLKHLNLHYLNLHRLPSFIYEFRSLVTRKNGVSPHSIQVTCFENAALQVVASRKGHLGWKTEFLQRLTIEWMAVAQ